VTITPVSHSFVVSSDGGGFDGGSLSLRVHDWGGTGAPVLLAHATGFHGRIWAPVAEQLLATGRHPYSFDFRGHGDSDAPPVEEESYAWSHFAADALAVADHLGIAGDDRLVACGHSKGAAALLLGEAEHPRTYARIWAYEPILFGTDEVRPPDPDFVLARSARKRRTEWPSIEAAYEAYAAKPPLEVLSPESLHAYVDYGLRDRGDGVFELKCRPEVEAQTYSMAPANGLWSRLPDVHATVRVVCGELSNDITPTMGAKIASRLPHGSAEVMPGAGHFGPQSDPELAAASIERFVRATTPSDR
jgi:pimeloyl-ACP methyl ester carboxylesterase